MAPTVDDPEVAAFIEGLPRHLTYTEMTAACQERFGPERAWSADAIRRYWLKHHPITKGTFSRIDRDAELRLFIEDRIGRMTLDEIVTACETRFGHDRTPSRSTIHLHSQKMRGT